MAGFLFRVRPSVLGSTFQRNNSRRNAEVLWSAISASSELRLVSSRSRRKPTGPGCFRVTGTWWGCYTLYNCIWNCSIQLRVLGLSRIARGEVVSFCVPAVFWWLFYTFLIFGSSSCIIFAVVRSTFVAFALSSSFAADRICCWISPCHGVRMFLMWLFLVDVTFPFWSRSIGRCDFTPHDVR